MNFQKDIYSFINSEETNYSTQEVTVFDNFSWNMMAHIQTSLAMKNGKFITASNDLKTKNPFKNIVLPAVRFRYHAEDIDVKDITIYVDDPDLFHLSFLVKKYYDDVFIVENDLDTFFDRAIVQKVDFGGVLTKKGKGAVPEVIKLESIAFCDQTNLLGGPIGLKFNFSPDELRAKAKMGWGDTSKGATITIEGLISLAKQEKEASTTTQTESNKTTGTNIEVYIVRGGMPEMYLSGESEKPLNQIQVVAFYTSKDGKHGVTLYKSKETEDVYKAFIPQSEEIHNRALSYGG